MYATYRFSSHVFLPVSSPLFFIRSRPILMRGSSLNEHCSKPKEKCSVSNYALTVLFTSLILKDCTHFSVKLGWYGAEVMCWYRFLWWILQIPQMWFEVCYRWQFALVKHHVKKTVLKASMVCEDVDVLIGITFGLFE